MATGETRDDGVWKRAFALRAPMIAAVVTDGLVIAVLIVTNWALAGVAHKLKQEGLDALFVSGLQIVFGVSTLAAAAIMVYGETARAWRAVRREDRADD